MVQPSLLLRIPSHSKKSPKPVTKSHSSLTRHVPGPALPQVTSPCPAQQQNRPGAAAARDYVHKQGSQLLTFIVVSVAIWVVAFPKQLQVFFITQ